VEEAPRRGFAEQCKLLIGDKMEVSADVTWKEWKHSSELWPDGLCGVSLTGETGYRGLARLNPR
jgi:hypothetical protein